jgi:hypothetical protein
MNSLARTEANPARLMEGRVKYDCMAIGWFHELLREERVSSLEEAEAILAQMLEENAMIVHAYRETEPETPELVGRHVRLCAFTSDVSLQKDSPAPAHEICRFLLDSDSVADWQAAKERDTLLESRWLVVDVYPALDGTELPVYGKAKLLPQAMSAEAC